MTVLFFLLGLVALVLGAELLVRGASRLALSLGISPLVVGLTVVAFGTSSPELAVSVQSALAGQADIAVGNVVGSNIFNVLFILGASAIITPLVVSQQLIRQEVPVMVGVSLLLWLPASDGGINLAQDFGRVIQDPRPVFCVRRNHSPFTLFEELLFSIEFKFQFTRQHIGDLFMKMPVFR